MGAPDRALTTADRIEDYQDSLVGEFFYRSLLKRTSTVVDVGEGIDKVSVDGLTFAYRSRFMTVKKWQDWGREITITVASPKHPYPDTYVPETVKWGTMTALVYTIVEAWPAEGATLKEQKALVLSSSIVRLAENAELIRETFNYPKHTSSSSGCEFVCVPMEIFPRETFKTVLGGAGRKVTTELTA